MVQVIEGQLSAAGLRLAIVAARFNSFIVQHLVEGAIDTVVRHGGNKNDLTLVHVPGSYELPLTCKMLAESGKYDAVIALGAVIRGATTHYDLVCSEAAKGIAHASISTSTPISFGVITTDTIEQAIERAGTKAGNKGVDAAMAAIEMAQVVKQIQKGNL
ncbi:MAG: 6,7-dimethyl-8-ribityllumazine synthase [Deltaproteobacteria bacterium]|nr:6,7-dimethyl-8-ribityllumazine synthase [Deltaproteobacteria bacterium]